MTAQATQTSAKSDDKNRTAKSEEHQAAVIIQKHVRGYQARKMKKNVELMAKERQRSYITRPFREWKDSVSQDCDSSTIASSEISTDPSTSIGSQTQIGDLQTDIDKLSFAAEAAFEGLTIGDSCDPPCVVLIASNVPNACALQRCVLEGVLSTVYEYADNTLPSLLRKVRALLNEYQLGVKAKSIALVCQGGPGYLYLLAGKVITPAKLSTNIAISKFWVELGDMISKINPTEACVDFIGSNVSGNKQGEQLLRDLEKVVQPNIVHMRSLLEVSSEGQQMLGSYFNVTSYQTWKMKRRTKILLT
jgi:hypothetical protein